MGDNVWKRTLIPHNTTESHVLVVKDFEKTRTQKVNPAGKTARKNELVFVLVLRAKALIQILSDREVA